MITSFRNPLIKRIKRLRRKKYRRQEQAFFIEGLRVVLTALEQGAPLECLVYAPDLLTSEAALTALRQQEAVGLDCVSISAELFQSISERDNPPGLGAIVAARETPLSDWPVGPGDLFIALNEVADPGNLGTVLRTADAAGAAGVILVGQTVDPYHPTVLKASMGTFFTMPFCQVDDAASLLVWARPQGLQVVATSAGAQHSFWQADYRLPALLLMGSEKFGLPAEVLDAADLAVAIPMTGSASSLNLAAAAALLLYEIRRRRPD